MQSLHCKQEESKEEEEMKLQQIMLIMTELIRKLRSEGRMDAKDRWCVSELLRQTVRKYFAEIQKLVGGDEKERRERKADQHKVRQIFQGAREVRVSCTKFQCLQHGQKARWIVVKRQGKNGQNTATKAYRKWRTSLGKREELKRPEEAVPRLKKCDLKKKVSRLYKAKTGVGCDGFHSKVPLGRHSGDKR